MVFTELYEFEFKRIFSTCFYKTLKLPLCEFELSKDFTGDCRGDKYPVIRSHGEFCETVKNGVYSFKSENADISRLISRLHPYATYEMTVDELGGECGFSFFNGDEMCFVTVGTDDNGFIYAAYRDNDSALRQTTAVAFKKGLVFSFTLRPGKADIYLKTEYYPEFIIDFDAPFFKNAASEKFMTDTAACVYFSGDAAVSGAAVFMDSGISQADIRAVTYENGDVICENGKVFLTASVRQQAGGYQAVLSWVPGTEKFELTGALLFDAGDGLLCSDVAAHLVFDRRNAEWILWVCSFSHGHILARTSFKNDVRYGVNAVDVRLVEKRKEGETDSDFGGKQGDEDPALVYDEKRGKWLLAVCRSSCINGSYCYHFFESDSPLDGFSYIGKGAVGCETGGSFVKTGGKLYFVCGNSFEIKSDYRVYDFDDTQTAHKLEFDYPDGGFRGWGSIIPLIIGTRERLFMLTFDRHKGSDFNWSYGNLYCFEGGFKKTNDRTGV